MICHLSPEMQTTTVLVRPMQQNSGSDAPMHWIYVLKCCPKLWPRMCLWMPASCFLVLVCILKLFDDKGLKNQACFHHLSSSKLQESRSESEVPINFVALKLNNSDESSSSNCIFPCSNEVLWSDWTTPVSFGSFRKCPLEGKTFHTKSKKNAHNNNK